jgi:hypothetical protein
MAEAALDLGATFLRTQVDSQKPSEYSQQLLLATRAQIEQPRAQPVRSHPTPWLRSTTSRLQLQGTCPPPEGACFRGRAGYLLAIGTPSRGAGDSVVVPVSLAGYHPDPRQVLPPGLGVPPPPTGGAAVPVTWSFATDWVLILAPDTTGKLHITKVGPPTASDAF